MPVVRGNITHPRILDKVEVTRDQKGIPRIIGHRTRDVYFAQGYVHAQDRIFQMTLMKHMFLGRMSEIMGERTIKLDQYMRYFNIEASAQASFSNFGVSFQKDLESYAEGVNAYIQENRKTIEAKLLGHQVSPWRPQDSIVIQKAIAFDMSRHWPRIMRNSTLVAEHGLQILDEYYPIDEVVEPSVTDEDLIRSRLPYDINPKVYPDGPKIPSGVVDSFKDFALLNDTILSSISADDETLSPGSNIWAVSPERSESGQTVMASDPHLSYNVPNTFYLVHLKSDQMSLTGASIPGSPGIIIGRNDKVSWGFTNSRLDQSDVFYGKDIPGKVAREEVIKVKGGEDKVLTYFDSEYGTIVSKPGAEYDIAFSWTGMALQDPTLEAIAQFCTARSLQELKHFTRNFHTPSQNLVGVDDQGNYGLYVVGSIPDRKHSGRIAVPATHEYQWKKTIPHWEMPYAENPKRGYVMNANSHVVSAHYGHNLSKLGFDDLRAIRLVKMLNEDKIFTVADHKKIQMDNEDQQWFIMKDALMTTQPSSDLAKSALEALGAWDGQANRDSYQVTIVSSWQRELSKVYQPIAKTVPKWAKPVHDDFFVRDSLLSNSSVCHTDQGGCETFLTQTLESAVNKLAKQYGTSDVTQWKWGESHKAIFKHSIFKNVPLLKQFTQRQISVDGTRDSLNRSRWFSGDAGFMGTQGACLRMIVDMDVITGEFSMPMGESGNIFSKHYDDLLEGWANGSYMTLPRTQARGPEAQLLFYAE